MIIPIAIGSVLLGAIGWALTRKPDVVTEGTASIGPLTHTRSVTAASATDTVATANAAALSLPENMVPVEFNGETWLVAPEYIGPVGIGEARAIAASLGLELPSSGLVDAIWRAADLRIDPPVRASDGTPKTMSTPAVFEAQRQRIESIIDGRPFTLLAGTHKDVVTLSNGKPGLYGWNVEIPAAFTKATGVATHTVRGTSGVKVEGGPVVQQEFGGHGLDWKDYSQGLRLVRRA